MIVARMRRRRDTGQPFTVVVVVDVVVVVGDLVSAWHALVLSQRDVA
jgi:hypothetical protein